MLRLTLEVKTFSTLLLLSSLAISCVLSLVESANAESLRDPTQVPSNMVATDGNQTSATQATENAGPVLQSVMLGAKYRAAIINGKKVKLGDRYEQAKLVGLTENSATLKNADGTTQTLVMTYGAIQKPPVNQKVNRHPLWNQ